MNRSWDISEWQVFPPNFETHMKLRFNSLAELDFSVTKNAVVKHVVFRIKQGTVFLYKPCNKDLIYLLGESYCDALCGGLFGWTVMI